MKKLLGLGGGLAVVMLWTSCAGSTSRVPQVQIFNDMRQQDKYKPQEESKLPQFADRRTDRRPVPGTMPRGAYHSETDVFYTGVVNGNYVTKNPLGITAETLQLGHMRFNTYCSPCHGRLADGKGIVGKRSNWIASSMIDDRVLAFADGDFFDVITHGRRTMPSYRYQITEHDRWAIIAYVRVLQRASHASIDDVPAELRGDIH